MLVVARVEQCVDEPGIARYSATILRRASASARGATRIFLTDLS
ncbi:MAG: hypothetical protein ACI8PT_003514 [Gammaproteobacteria bacterium]|jgi:hypothetical protein